MATKPRFLYNNVLNGITPSFSGTTVAEKPPVNSVDWLSFTYFEADSGNLDFTMGSNTTIDSLSIYVATVSGSNSITLQYESSPSTFTTLQTNPTVSGKLTFDSFSEVTVSSGRRIRFVIAAATTMNIRHLTVGQYMEAEQGQYASMTYPTLLGGIKVTNTISANGEVIGRSLKRQERGGQIDLEYLTPNFIRNTWEPFADHAAKFPFIYLPAPTEQPTDVGFSFAEGINSPKNMGKGDFMSVSMKIRSLVGDEHVLT